MLSTLSPSELAKSPKSGGLAFGIGSTPQHALTELNISMTLSGFDACVNVHLVQLQSLVCAYGDVFHQDDIYNLEVKSNNDINVKDTNIAE